MNADPATRAANILEKVAGVYSLKVEDLKGPSRLALVVEARHVAMYLVRELLGTPLQQIGQLYGGRDHSTVLYSIRKVATRMGDDAEFRDRVEDVMSELRGDAESAFLH